MSKTAQGIEMVMKVNVVFIWDLIGLIVLYDLILHLSLIQEGNKQTMA